MENLEYTLIPYTNEDYDFVYEAKKIAYKKYVELNWGEWNEKKQREMFVDFINTYKNKIKIIMINNQKAGFYHGEDIDNNGYEIGNICINPEFQGKGVGTKILRDVLQKNNDKNIYLRYFKQNPVVKLYERLGFRIIEELPYHFRMERKAYILIK